MAKEAMFSMKLEPELRAEFMAAAESVHRPASQVLRERILILKKVNQKIQLP